MNHRLRVLCITGSSRSGSTILGAALGQIDGLFCAGELQRIWDKDWLTDEHCSCGAPILKCPIWSAIFKEVIGSYDAKVARRLRWARNRVVRLYGLPRLLLTRSAEQLPGAVREYLALTERLYHTIQKHTGCRVIVDTSKYPTYSYLLRLVPSLDVRVVHLVRDSRAVAYSWQRFKSYPTAKGIRHMERHIAPRSAAAWNALNGLADLLWERDEARFRLVRYEDFVSQPRQTFQTILSHAGEPDASPPLVGDDTLDIQRHHIIAGNANRFQTGHVRLHMDTEWQTRLGCADVAIVTALTFPLLRKYGYLISGAAALAPQNQAASVITASSTPPQL
jgi:hypothetical protein